MSALSTIQHIFPAPRYITLPSVGVDISDSSLKYVQFENKHARSGDLVLKQWGDIDIPSGVVERGNVHDIGKLTSVLKEVQKCCGTEYIRVSLPEERAYLFETSIKHGTPYNEIRGLLEFKLEENVPLSPREVFFDYDIVGDEGGSLQVIVAVYAKDTIKNYYEACQSAGLIPLSFEIEAQAIARAVVRADHPGTYMIIDFGKTRMGVGIVKNGALMYTSTIDSGGLVMSEAMRKKLGNLAESELSKIKNTQGILQTEKNAEVYDALRGVLGTITEELETRIHYWHTRDVHRKEREIEKIILCGGSSNLAGFPEYLADTLSIPTERAKVWQNAFNIETYVPPITYRYSYGYATAIGLALGGFRERNT